MDRAENEVAALEEAVKKAAEDQLRALSELQLAFAGGGSGDTILA